MDSILFYVMISIQTQKSYLIHRKQPYVETRSNKSTTRNQEKQDQNIRSSIILIAKDFCFSQLLKIQNIGQASVKRMHHQRNQMDGKTVIVNGCDFF